MALKTDVAEEQSMPVLNVFQPQALLFLCRVIPKQTYWELKHPVKEHSAALTYQMAHCLNTT